MLYTKFPYVYCGQLPHYRILVLLYVHYFLFHISKRLVFFWLLSFSIPKTFTVSRNNSLFYSYHQLVTIADKAAVSAGVVQSAVRNYINLNIGEQLGRSLLLPPPPPLEFGFGSGSRSKEIDQN
jgi:hypothetical protein